MDSYFYQKINNEVIKIHEFSNKIILLIDLIILLNIYFSK